MTDPHDDPDWAPWDVESARRWALPPEPTVPRLAHWCAACGRLEHRGDPLHNAGTAAPVDPPRPCRAVTVHPVTVTPEGGSVFTGLWCVTCRYLVPSAEDAHPDEWSRPFRAGGCARERTHRVTVA